ncbi:MAG TPA: tRNA pseudouridine(38-40) synthase TruA [Salinimicrobium sp.]|nr:tRNA pseudouridine(38-40) synthase TruA [Salinimicrobium sp.]
MRYFIELAYNGTSYHGWQRQPQSISVQQVIEEALHRILKEKIAIMGAGRTDAGVHAIQIFAHFDLERELGDMDFIFRMNSLLPKDIAVRSFFKVKNNAHARFDALHRSYEYHIVQEKNPFEIERSYLLKKDLDLSKMNEACKILLGTKDFKCFSKSRTDVRTYICTIEHAFWERKNEKLIFYIKADRFLRNMVRAIVGTLLEIGTGKLEITYLNKIIESRNRSEAGTSVPAHGLYLSKIEYPKNIRID